MKYQMRERMLAIWRRLLDLEAETGERAFRVDGKAFRVRKDAGAGDARG